MIPFRPGQSGKPGGKYIYAPNRLTNGFTNALADDFDHYGVAAIDQCCRNSLARLLAIIASLMPSEQKRDQCNSMAQFTDEDLVAVVHQLQRQIACSELSAGDAVGLQGPALLIAGGVAVRQSPHLYSS